MPASVASPRMVPGAASSLLSKSALLQCVRMSRTFDPEGVVMSATPDSAAMRASHTWILESNQMCVTVIRFCVRVPVLSEAITVTQPRVSTVCSCFTKTFSVASRCATICRQVVTVEGRPCGIFATVMEMAISRAPCQSIAGFRVIPRTRQMTPSKMAMMVIRMTNNRSSLPMVVSFGLFPAVRLAISPISVLSPVPMQIPTASPSRTIVPDHNMFSASSTFFCLLVGPRVCGSASPVSAELSTLTFEQWITRMSAGTLSPIFTTHTSPGTISSASTCWAFPSRRT
mmetsp:Transcript_43845/g.86518  ORF Transcript_43845/g.86518 Transcript_43845/m.86518 type:complete len:286 (-) Transcript_43845:489-1346(-)